MNEGEPYYIHDILLRPPFQSLVKLSMTVHTRYTLRMRGTVNWWAGPFLPFY